MNKLRPYLFYTIDALLIGSIVGIIDTIFGRLLLEIGELRSDYLLFLLPFLAPCGLFITYLNRSYGGKSQKGMELLFEVGEGREKDIPKRLIPLTILSTWLTHLFGGSAGRPTWGNSRPCSKKRFPWAPCFEDLFGHWDGSWLRWTLSDPLSCDFLCHGGPSGRQNRVAGPLSCDNCSFCR